MTVETMKKRLSVLTGEDNEDLLNFYLELAAEKIISKCYPYRLEHETKSVPEKYHNLQLEIAVYLRGKQGAEGETVHNENGVNRTYESADVPDSMLKTVLPFAAVMP